ncbi:MAG: gliding motility-associated protein GldE [Chitinophagia bacterium]
MEPHSGPLFISSINYLLQLQQDSGLLILMCILLFLSFVIAGSEVAFFSLSYKDIQSIKNKPYRPFQRIIILLEEPKKLLTSMLIANSFINICIILIANVVIDHFFTFDKISLPGFEFVVKVVLVTLLLLFFGEILPKVMATQNNIRFAQDFSFIIQGVYFIFSKPSAFMVKYTNSIEKILAQKRNNNSYSREELDHAIELTTSPVHQTHEKNILKGIVKFGNISVKQIMKTRLDVDGVEEQIGFDTLLDHIKEHNYSRFPIYKEDLDTIVGMIHTKDIIPHINEGANYNWRPLIRPAYFVHEQKMIDDLLKEFQLKHIHFAVVVDEFGGTSGIITLEDILEEIVGDIKDEFDEEESMIKKIDDYHYIVEGKTTINDFCNFIDMATATFDVVKGDSDTMAGLFLELAGHFPALQQVVKFKQFSFTVMEIQKNRIHKIQLIIAPLSAQFPDHA